jgi:hypothetical protein
MAAGATMEMHYGCDLEALYVLKAAHLTEEMQTGIVVCHSELEPGLDHHLAARGYHPQQRFQHEDIVSFSCDMKRKRAGLAYALQEDPRETDQRQRI